MEEEAKRNGNGASSSSPKRDLVVQLYERIARLHAVIQELRDTSENLEADRQRLLEENRALRRKVTLSTLIEDLEIVIPDERDEAKMIEHPAPSSANRLYQQLPARFSSDPNDTAWAS